jgi:hypothetical protein
MNNKKLLDAERKVNKAAKMLKNKSILELKYSDFVTLQGEIILAATLLSECKFVCSIPVPPLTEDFLISYFDTHYPKWRSSARTHFNKIPRQVLQYLMAQNTGLSLKEIAQRTGGFHHTTIINSRRLVSNMISTNDYKYISVYNDVMEHRNSIINN